MSFSYCKFLKWHKTLTVFLVESDFAIQFFHINSKKWEQSDRISQSFQLLSFKIFNFQIMMLSYFQFFFRNYAPQGIGAGNPYKTDGTTLIWENALRCSCLIYNPQRRQDIWRFGTYMFLHSGWLHLFWNISIQLLVGEF